MSKDPGMETYLSYLGVDGAKDDPQPPLSIKPQPQPSAPASPAAPIPPLVTKSAAAPAVASETSVLRLNLSGSLQGTKDQLQPMRLPRAEQGVGETRVDYVAPPTPAAAGEKPVLKAKEPVASKPVSKAVLPAAPPRKSSAALLAAAVVVLGLGIGAWVLPMVSSRSSAALVSNPPPATARAVRATGAAPSPPPSPTVEKCLRQSSQTINSQLRDELLRQIVEDVDTGKHAQALTGLRRYTAEACDHATLEAVEILSRQFGPRHKK